MNTYRILEIIALILLGILFISLVILISIDEATKKVTYTNQYDKCYDKNGNLINEVTCVKEIKCGIIAQKTNPNRCFNGVEAVK